jgi:S-adenosylmethionine:tRNA ribosyltransferase-isomerase
MPGTPGASDPGRTAIRAAWPELDLDVPDDRIARHPAGRRADARLLVLPLSGGPFEHRRFTDLPALLRPGDRLVVNDSRVMAARLRARRRTGGAVELLCLSTGPGPIPVLARPARKLSVGEDLTLDGGRAVVLDHLGEGRLLVQFDPEPAVLMASSGEIPLPPYLRRQETPEDRERYQTVFARAPGSAAAPTAGLHFDPPLLGALEHAGVSLSTVTLHVGLGTFLPLRDEDLAAGRLHREQYEVPEVTAEAIARTRAEGGRVIAVGTTSARTLEAATPSGATHPEPGPGTTELLIAPPYRFRALDGLITNFHLPGSSLLLLVAALLGPRRTRQAYDEALAHGYRFYSYGDATLML